MATYHTGMATASMSARFILRLTLAMSFAAICWKSVAADTSSKGLLRAAMEDSRMASYCCAVDDDELLSEMGAASGRFWRLRLPDGFICRKMELYDDAGKAVVVFTQDRTGNYAMAMGKWGRVSEILPLWYFDDMARGFDDFEAGLASFSQRAINYEGRDAREICMETPRDIARLKFGGNREIAIWGMKGSADLNSRLYATRPMRRVFIIDPDSGLILSRTHLNVKGQKVYGRRIRLSSHDIDVAESDFAPGGRVAGSHLMLYDGFLADYFSSILQTRITPRNRGLGIYDDPAYEHGWLSQFLDWFLSEENTGRMATGTGILAIVSLAIAAFIRLRRR